MAASRPGGSDPESAKFAAMAPAPHNSENKAAPEGGDVPEFFRIASANDLEHEAYSVFRHIGALESLARWDEVTTRDVLGCDLAKFAEAGAERAVGAVEVLVDRSRPGLQVEIGDRSDRLAAAGVGDDGAERPADGLLGDGHGACHRCFDGDIGDDCVERTGAFEGRRLSDGGEEAVFGTPTDGDGRSVDREPTCHGKADAAAAAGDQRTDPCELLVRRAQRRLRIVWGSQGLMVEVTGDRLPGRRGGH